MCSLCGVFVIKNVHTHRNILNAPNKNGLVKYIWVCPNNGVVFKISIHTNMNR